MTDCVNPGTHIVTSSFFKPKDSFMYPILECVSSIGNLSAYELQLFGGFCASQLVTKIERNICPVVHAVSIDTRSHITEFYLRAFPFQGEDYFTLTTCKDCYRLHIGEINHLLVSVCPSNCVCGSYVVHHFNDTELRCAPLLYMRSLTI